MGEAHDPPPLPERLRQRLAEGDPHVLDRVMEVDVRIPLDGEVDPQPGVGGEGGQHVGEEAVGDLDAARAAVEREGEADAGLAGGALDAGGPRRMGRPRPGGTSPAPTFRFGGRGARGLTRSIPPRAARIARSAAPVPTDTRRQPASPG